MKQIITTFLLIFFSMSVSAQSAETITLELLYQNSQYDEIIDRHASKAKKYPARAIYFVGMAYYMKENDKNCIKYMDMSIEKDPNDPDPHYIKGMTLNYMGQFNDAVISFEKAIAINDTTSVFYSGLGDAHYNLEALDKALAAYQKATTLNDATDRPYSMIPQIYNRLNQKDKALKAFYTAKDNISEASNSYINVLYNIGLFELLEKNYAKSELAFKELIKIVPNDYHTYAKLVQIYYAQEEYDKATPLKTQLYEAHSKGLLEDNMKDMFCFNQFNWNDKLVQVFERFAAPEGELYYKHLFYIINEEGQIEYRIQTENSVISVELGGPKYLLGMNKGDTHYTFTVGFNEDFEYINLKNTVIKVLEGELKPGASSQPGK